MLPQWLQLGLVALLAAGLYTMAALLVSLWAVSLDVSPSGVGVVAASGSVAPLLLAVPVGAAAGQLGTRRLLAVAAVLILIAVLAGALVVTRTQGPQLQLSAESVPAGDLLSLAAHQLPAGQSGNVVLESTPRVLGSFHADARGDASVVVRIPRETPAGSHQVRLCWIGTCHASASVRVT